MGRPIKITVFFGGETAAAGEVLKTALIRSFTDLQIEVADYSAEFDFQGGAVLINPGLKNRGLMRRLLSANCKILITGRLDETIAEEIGIASAPLPEEAQTWPCVKTDPAAPFDVSNVSVAYRGDHQLCRDLPSVRYLCRYDFTEEWNNGGYGLIPVDGSIWSLCNLAWAKEALPLASLRQHEGGDVGHYAVLFENSSSAVLWYNRQVGPVDSLEWQVVERFFGDYRPDDLPCFPYLSEIPAGRRGVVTMRLDCDQAISSARPLFELYGDHHLPLSLAVLTGLSMGDKDLRFLDMVLESGGSVLAHSHSHLPCWGGDYGMALTEARQSKKELEEAMPRARPVQFAVSPFHQNPLFAVRGLRDAGFGGFVGGIISSDPEFLLGRSGRVPWVEGMVSLSQQCMLHGDCYHRYGNSLEPYKETYENHLAASSVFGYLDHPFSSEYWYGWYTEEERLAVHEELLSFMTRQPDIWFPSLGDCLAFIQKKDRIQISTANGKVAVETTAKEPTDIPIAYRYRGSSFAF